MIQEKIVHIDSKAMKRVVTNTPAPSPPLWFFYVLPNEEPDDEPAVKDGLFCNQDYHLIRSIYYLHFLDIM